MTQDCRIDYTKAKSPKIKIKHWRCPVLAVFAIITKSLQIQQLASMNQHTQEIAHLKNLKSSQK
jgi:hypothetical protein